MHQSPTGCPICGGALTVNELSCDKCDIQILGKFKHLSCDYCSQEKKYQDFLEMFLRHRGNLNAIGKVMGISYPTVRARLNSLLLQLGYATPEDIAQLSKPRAKKAGASATKTKTATAATKGTKGRPKRIGK